MLTYLEVKRCLFCCSNLTDGEGRWIGGTTHLVQTGDIVDRGPNSTALIDLFARLRVSAPANPDPRTTWPNGVPSKACRCWLSSAYLLCTRYDINMSKFVWVGRRGNGGSQPRKFCKRTELLLTVKEEGRET
eukprot:1086864-Prorocentrum_minimum.AAC.3